MSDQWFDIPASAKQLELSENYVRAMVRQRIIPSTMFPVREGSTVMKHMIKLTDLYIFSQRDGAKSPRRPDGRNKQVFYATRDEVLRVKELLYATHDPALEIVAESIIVKETKNGHYIPPSRLTAVEEPGNPETGSPEERRERS